MHSGMTRRDLLRGGVAAGALALGADPLISRALAMAKTGPGKLSDIEHVIFLIQENRSFDHYFGTMAGVRGFADEGGAHLSQPGYEAPGFEGHLLPFHLQSASQCFPDITHSWVPQHESWDGGAMDAFVKAHLAADGSAAGPATMGYYERADIPFYHSLAEAFTLCDGYYCSTLGPTDPNRLYSMSGTIDPDGLNGGPLVTTLSLTQRPKFEGRFTWTTMPEQLSAAGVSWKVYNGTTLGVLDNPLPLFKNFQTNEELAARGIKPTYPTDFNSDLAAGTLPQVSWINMSVDESEHPDLSTPAVGEYALAKLVGKLVKNKRTWEKTALFVTWDENGGFFDHVAPPVAPPGTAGEYLTAPDITNDSGGVTGPIGLGFRVPMLIVSPFSAGGFLSSEPFDHTSMLRFLETRFGVEVPNLSSWRREAVGDLTSAFNFAEPKAAKPPLPKVHLTPKQRQNGGCQKATPVIVPPNSTPEQEPGGHWRVPSGP